MRFCAEGGALEFKLPAEKSEPLLLQADSAPGFGNFGKVALIKMFGEKIEGRKGVGIGCDQAASFLRGGETDFMPDVRLRRSQSGGHRVFKGGVDIVTMEKAVERIDVSF